MEKVLSVELEHIYGVLVSGTEFEEDKKYTIENEGFVRFIYNLPVVYGQFNLKILLTKLFQTYESIYVISISLHLSF